MRERSFRILSHSSARMVRGPWLPIDWSRDIVGRFPSRQDALTWIEKGIGTVNAIPSPERSTEFS